MKACVSTHPRTHKTLFLTHVLSLSLYLTFVLVPHTNTLPHLTLSLPRSLSFSLSLVLVQHVEKVEDAVASESRTLGSAGGRWTHQSPVLGSLEARRAKKLVRVRACESE